MCGGGSHFFSLSFIAQKATRREMQDLRRNFVASLQSTHHVACVWRAHRVDPGPIFCPSAHTAVAQYHRRVNTWNGFNCPSLAPHSVPEKEGTPDGIERNVHVLAVMGWEGAVPATNTEPTLYCRLCARHVWIDERTPFGMMTCVCVVLLQLTSFRRCEAASSCLSCFA